MLWCTEPPGFVPNHQILSAQYTYGIHIAYSEATHLTDWYPAVCWIAILGPSNTPFRWTSFVARSGSAYVALCRTSLTSFCWTSFVARSGSAFVALVWLTFVAFTELAFAELAFAELASTELAFT